MDTEPPSSLNVNARFDFVFNWLLSTTSTWWAPGIFVEKCHCCQVQMLQLCLRHTWREEREELAHFGAESFDITGDCCPIL